jgi:hypothetical protein
MPMWKISTSSGGSGGSVSKRRQHNHLGDLLAEQLVRGAWMSSPGARPRPEPFSYLLMQIITLSSGCAPVLLTM